MYPTDASASRGLLAISQAVDTAPRRERVRLLLLDPESRTVVHEWPVDAQQGFLFADGGKALCGLAGTARDGVARCWDTDTGKEIAETKGLNVHGSMRTAASAKRVVVSVYGVGFDFEDFAAKVGSLRRRVVWDFGTGKEVASWKPRWETFVIDMNPPEEKWLTYRFALSPDGAYLVEGGAGVIDLYRIEP
jgi:hypothetical protein